MKKKRFTIEFECENAAFDVPGEIEIARILMEIGADVLQSGTGGPIHDLNGNRIGKWEWRS